MEWSPRKKSAQVFRDVKQCIWNLMPFLSLLTKRIHISTWRRQRNLFGWWNKSKKIEENQVLKTTCALGSIILKYEPMFLGRSFLLPPFVLQRRALFHSIRNKDKEFFFFFKRERVATIVWGPFPEALKLIGIMETIMANKIVLTYLVNIVDTS